MALRDGSLLEKAVASIPPLQTAALIHRLWLNGGRSRGVAKRLLEMEIGVAYRTGHVVTMMDSALQHDVIAAARVGLVAPAIAPCARCGVEAPLYDWSLLGMMGFDAHREAIMQAHREGSISRFGYLLVCRPGSGVRQPTSAGGYAWYRMAHGPESQEGEGYYAQG